MLFKVFFAVCCIFFYYGMLCDLVQFGKLFLTGALPEISNGGNYFMGMGAELFQSGFKQFWSPYHCKG